MHSTEKEMNVEREVENPHVCFIFMVRRKVGAGGRWYIKLVHFENYCLLIHFFFEARKTECRLNLFLE